MACPMSQHLSLPHEAVQEGYILFLKSQEEVHPDILLQCEIALGALCHPVVVINASRHSESVDICLVSKPERCTEYLRRLPLD